MKKTQLIDHFVNKDGKTFAGTHVILDLWNCVSLDDEDLIDRALRQSVKAAKATLLHIHLHKFEPNGGISGVAVLAESHMSIHTWPERGYAALDIFMCGSADPLLTVPVLEKHFKPSKVIQEKWYRGMVYD